MRLAVLLVVLVATFTACGTKSDDQAKVESGTEARETCGAPVKDDDVVRELVVQPSTVEAGTRIALRLGEGQTVAPEAVTVNGSAPRCRSFILDKGGLIELRDGDVSQSALSFEREVAFNIPPDAESGSYAVCTVTPEGPSTVDACGSLTVR